MSIKIFATYLLAMAIPTLAIVGCTEDEETSPEDTSAEATFAKRLVGTFVRVSPVPAPDGSTAYLRPTITLEASDSPTTAIQSLSTEAFFDDSNSEVV